MYTLYPAIKPYKIHKIKVSKLHTLYVEEVGNPSGLPVIILHDGPGGGGNICLRRFFDPQIFRMIIFDQRGCGRSSPHANTKENTTFDLIEDIETIREKLKLSQMTLFGGGWGALLALIYAKNYPQYIRNLILYRIFLGRKKEVSWLFKHGANLIYPDYWQEFIEIIPKELAVNPIDYYGEVLEGSNDLMRMAAAKNWAHWQANCSSLHPCSLLIEEYTEPHFAMSLASLQCHYLKNKYFLEENQALENIHKIRHLPTYIVHGRYDAISPMINAWELYKLLPHASLSVIREAGHSDKDPGIIDALVGATIIISKENPDVC